MAGPRRNKSNKVAGVKLRPSLPVAKSKRKDSGFEDSTIDDGNSSDLDTTYVGDICPRPFKTVVICATGIVDKTTLSKQAIELGAQPLSDLTDRVTHLIAEEPGSAKYKCALENGIPIMHPSWITKSYEVWLRGDNVDFQESLQNHRLPIFSDVVLSITGFDDISKRTEIHKLVTQHGGTYVKNIERPVRVTHLICFNSAHTTSGSESESRSAEEELMALRETSDKVKYAEKFIARKEANVQIVWEDWFWDCVACGGRWDENLYKVGVVTKEGVKKRSEELKTARESQASRQLRITTSDLTTSMSALQTADLNLDNVDQDEEEPASIKRVPGAKLALWGSLLKPRGFMVEEGKLVRSPSKSHSERRDANPGADLEDSPSKKRADRMKAQTQAQNNAHGDGPGAGTKVKRSLLATLQRSKSVLPTGGQTQPQPLRRILTTGSGLRQDSAPPPAEATEAHVQPDLEPQSEAGPSNLNAASPEPDSAPKSTGIFANKTFRLLGEARSTSVKTAIEGAGGTVLSTQEVEDDPDDGDRVDFVLVRLVSGSALYHRASLTISPSKFRTECWLERCLFEERICPGEEHISFKPLGNKEPIKGVETVILSYSGLDQSEACWLRRLARALGLSIAPNFSRRSTHLICPSRTGTKFDKAIEWGIPVIDMNWFAEMVTIGYVPGFQTEVEVIDSDGTRKDKGKGKERATDMMVDITNAVPVAPRSRSPVPMDVDRENNFPPEPATQGHLSFGEPNHLLSAPSSSPNHRPSDTNPHSPPATPPPSSRAPTQEPYTSPAPPLPPPQSPSTPPRINPPQVRSDHERRPPAEPTRSQLALQYEREHTQIPSSQSPSPMKLPSPRKPISRAPSAVANEKSPSLLGKRPSPFTEGDSMLPPPEQQGLRSKRARPPSLTKVHLDDTTAMSSSPGPADVSVDITSPVRSSATTTTGKARRNIAMDYDTPSQAGERDKLLDMLHRQNKETWDGETPGDDDDASVIVLDGPPPLKKTPSAAKEQPAVVQSKAASKPPRPRPKPRKRNPKISKA